MPSAEMDVTDDLVKLRKDKVTSQSKQEYIAMNLIKNAIKNSYFNL